MKQKLDLKISQQLTLTPQLQQSIRLLQLSTVELSQEIQNFLESNPLLEVSDEQVPEVDMPHDLMSDVVSLDADDLQEKWFEAIPQELPVDSTWQDIYTNSTPALAQSPSSQNKFNEPDFSEKNTSSVDLRDHLTQQLELTKLDNNSYFAGLILIDSINSNGYLTAGLPDVLDQLPSEAEFTIEKLEDVLATIQQFNPIGVGARDLQECLLIQLDEYPSRANEVAAAKYIVKNHLDLLVKKDNATLKKCTHLDLETINKAIHLILTLNPRPGSAISSEEPNYVIPDLFVKKEQQRWVIELNQDICPKLTINQYYKNLAQKDSESSTYIRRNLQEARWFLKNLKSRNQTLLNVANKIFEYQFAFFEKGEQAMRPMVLQDIAEATGMHESTISRITTQKYINTPNGIYELKYFFSSQLATKSGNSCSSTAIKAFIKDIIGNEDPIKPLSDTRIAKLLSERGICIARRTITKYREVMSISPSNVRKRMFS